MKLRIIKIVTAFFLVSGFAYLACNKKKLDIPPPTQGEATYFNSELEFRNAVIGTYSELSPFFSSGGPGWGGSAVLQAWFQPGDDLTSDRDEPFEIFKGLNTGNGKVSNLFKASYILAARANKILTKVEDKASVFTTAGLKDNIIGEMLFLRAFAHYMLWNTFGTAPLDTIDINSPSQFNPGNSSSTQLLDQCIKDLTRAATILPASWGSNDVGRVTANSANGFLGKVLVFRATVNKSQADYQAAIAAFDKISGSILVADMNDNFDPDTENNPESLFEYQAGQNISGFNNSWLGNDDCDCGATGGFYEMFFNGSGTDQGGGLYPPTTKLINAFEVGDPRIDVTFNADKTSIAKYVKKRGGSINVGADLLATNHRILRLADVILLKAEAVLKSGGSKAQAIGLINDIRTRARAMVAGGTIPANLSTAETSDATIMQWIMDERFRELAAEGQRWYDLRRWSLGGELTLTSAFFNSNKTTIAYDDHFLNFPIPESETNKNPNIKQNPGY